MGTSLSEDNYLHLIVHPYHLVAIHTSLDVPCSTTHMHTAETYYEFSVEKVCQFYAVLLLRQAGKVG